MQKAVEAIYNRVYAQHNYNTWMKNLIQHIDSFDWGNIGVDHCYWKASFKESDTDLLTLRVSIEKEYIPIIKNCLDLTDKYTLDNIILRSIFEAKSDYQELEQVFIDAFPKEERYLSLNNEEAFNKAHDYINKLHKYLMYEMSFNKICT